MMTRFNVGDKVRVIDVDAIEYGVKHYYNGLETEILRIDDSDDIYLRNKYGEEGIYVGKKERHAIELVTESAPPKPKQSDRITALETELAELKAKVAAMEKAKETTNYNATVNFVGANTAETANKISEAFRKIAEYPYTARFEREVTEDADRIIADMARKSRTPNQRRVDVIKRAKAFVAKKDSQYESNGLVSLEFVVNPEKRTVVAIIHGLFSKRIRNKGIAKCDPSDVFNADIGKAIALGRALGVDVSEFEKAVQPTEVVVGMRTFHYYDDGSPVGNRVVNKVVYTNGEIRVTDHVTHGICGHVTFDEGDRITEDTDAVYE